MDRDREVYNNNKHLKPPADEHKKKQIREWEEAHPGEKCPDSYNLSLDASFADDEGSEDKSSLLYECAITMGAEDEEPDYIVRLHELRDELPESQLHTYRQVVEQEKSNAMYVPPYVYPHKAVTIIPQRKIHSNLITGILRPQRSTPLSVMWSKAVLPPVGWQKR